MSLDSQGQLSKLDMFHPIGGMETDEQRLKPIITTGVSPFLVSGIVNLSVSGATSAGGYVDLKWNPSINGVNYTINDASLGVYSMTDFNENSYDIGIFDKVSDSSIHVKSRCFSYFDYHINQSIRGLTHTVENINSLGLHSSVRTGSMEIQGYKNGILLESASAATTIIPNYNMYLLAVNGDGVAEYFSSRTISLVYAGAGSINQSILNKAINDYMVSRGLI